MKNYEDISFPEMSRDQLDQITNEDLHHLERLAIFQGNKYLLSACREEAVDFYESAGYRQGNRRARQSDGCIYLIKELPMAPVPANSISS